MDKNKNRTDLLAAGRKKLQQFRKKKDNKGNDSKSSSKSGRSGRDASAATESAATQKNVADGERSTLDMEDTNELSQSTYRLDSGASDTVASTDALSVKADSLETTIPAGTGESLSEGSRVDETHLNRSDVADGDRSKLDMEDTNELSQSTSRLDSGASDTVASTDAISVKADSLETTIPAGNDESLSEGSRVDETRLNRSDVDGHAVDSGIQQSSLVPQNEKHDVPGISDPVVLREDSVDSSVPLAFDLSSQLERQHGEEQVTDVGAMQEVDSSSRNQIDKGRQIEGHGSPSDEYSETTGNHMISDLENTETDEATYVAAQLSKSDEASSTGAATNDAEEAENKHNYSVLPAPLIESGTATAVSSEMTDQQGESTPHGLSNEEKAGIHNMSGGYGGGPTEGTQARSGVIDEEINLEFMTDDTAKSLGCKQVDLSSGLDGSLIKLSQLAEILKFLDEDEFRFLFLFMSRESSREVFIDTDKTRVNDSTVHDVFEKLKEQLYITSLSKDALHLQLSEHQKLIDEIPVANASVNEVQGKNEVLTAEIAQCRYELQEVLSASGELEKQLHFSKAEIEVFSAKIDELQNNLEITQGGMSSLSAELDDCRNLVEALQAENKSLNGSFKLINEEKEKLSGENGIILLENEKMKGELAQCKASLEALQKEEVDLTADLTLLRDERKQLEEEKHYIEHENSKLLADLEEYKSDLEMLKAENKNIKEIVTAVSEERKILEEEKESSFQHSEKLSNELLGCKDLVVTLQAEISNLKEGLRSVTEERNKFEEEKESILVDYEKHLDELAEINTSKAGLQAECGKAVDDLQRATFRFDQLAKENEILKTNLEFHKSNKEGFDLKDYSSKQEEVSRSVESEVLTSEKPKSECSSLELLKSNDFDNSSGFVALRRNLEDAAIVMKKLEEAVEAMHLHSTSLSRSSDKVSRLIQAFETKGHADELDPEEPPAENRTTEYPYIITKTVTENLAALLKDIVLDAENASEFCKGLMQSKILVDAAGTELQSKYDALEDHTDLVEQANIELMVLYEATKENISHAVAKEGELCISYDALQKQEVVLKSENSLLREKLDDLLVKSREVQSQLEEMYRDSEEKIASFSNQVKKLQEEVADRELIVEEEWNSVVTQVLQMVGELDASVETFHSNSLDVAGSIPDFVSRVVASVHGATKVIEDMRGQIEAAQRDRQAASDAFHDMHEKIRNLQLKNEIASSSLHRLYNDLNKLVTETLGCYSEETGNVLVDEETLDLFHPNVFDTPLDQLKRFLGERLLLESANKQLNEELTSRARDIDELEKKCLNSDTILKLVEDIEQYMKDGIEICEHEPAARLESLINLLVHKYNEAIQGLSLSTSQEMQLTDLQEQVEHLNYALVQYENENIVFKHSLKSAEEDVVSLNFRVQQKVAELEQSEQRVASLREKLSIAVSKGKGLISQRDSLKQSMAETSKELEKCSQELLSKDARLHELETKLKVYAEAGERMEALESELSYIRNSATALRESFLLKDSVLQRIEEILEDLELAEHFHSRDIIDKIDWLAKSVTGNSLNLNEWDQRSSVGGGSYPDAGFGGVDGLKEDMMPGGNPIEDLRRRYEELQNKFYGLAEQNDMLEQSLMERNNLVQQWEEILDRVDVPSHLRLLEPADKIQWLESALAEAQNQCSSHQEKNEMLEQSLMERNNLVQQWEEILERVDVPSHLRLEPADKIQWLESSLSEAENQCSSLQHKIDSLETSCESLTADVEDSRRRIAELEAAFHQVCGEKKILSRDLELLSHDNNENSKKTADLQFRNENLQNEVNMLQEQKLQIEEGRNHMDGSVRRLKELVEDALQISNTEDVVFGQEGFSYLEEMAGNLVEKYKALSSRNPVNLDPLDVHATDTRELSNVLRHSEKQDIATPKKELDESMGELVSLKEENDRYMLKNNSLVSEVEALEIKKNELQELLNQEEQRSTSLREKLNIAVRKGKSLVQQRDGMKQVIDELNAEVNRLKSEITFKESAITEYEEQMKNLSTSREREQVMESENILLRDRLAETERHLLEKEGIWSSIVDALNDIGNGLAFKSGNHIEKLKEIGNHLHDLRGSLNSSEQESRKSKRAAELLLAELEEVQERNDGLQEELAKTAHELSEVSREKELAETSKREALAHVEKISYTQAEEKDRLVSEFTQLKSGLDQIKEDLLATERELDDVLSNDLEVFHTVEAMIKSLLGLRSTPDLSAPFPHGLPGPVMSRNSDNKVFVAEIDSLKKRLHSHSQLLHEEARRLSEVVRKVHTEYTSQKDSYESVKRDVKRLESIEQEKEAELHILRRNISLLYQTCITAILDIENWKNHMDGNAVASRDNENNLKSQISIESSSNDTHTFNDEGIRGTCDKLQLVVKDFMSIKNELMEVGQREMKDTLLNLQKELQEKDVQRDRICMELVNQIKEAEAKAKNYYHDLQHVTAALHDSQAQVDGMKEERLIMEQRIKELQDKEIDSTDLQQKVNSLTHSLAAKEQEAEALMQALDEEEAQMEDLANKIERLDDELQQKNQDLENLEASRAKALKKLSVTVSKFDELHFFSESLLSEVEKLQAQLQERDGEISFLRQEVTRCTNDALAVTQMNKKRSSDEIHELLSWLNSLLSRVQVADANSDNVIGHQVDEYKETLQKQITALISELENLRVVAQKGDTLLQQERSKVEELTQKEQLLKNSLREKESQIVRLQGAGESPKATNSNSEIVEVEQMTNNWVSSGAIAPQVRSLRKSNNDQVAIAIDVDHSRDRLEDEDDDKAHGFKSLTTSKVVPRFTRPISNMIDGLWVSCDRALMRQPTLRLGVIIYWAILHALLATFVV